MALDANNQNNLTRYEYNDAQQLAQIIRADAKIVEYTYNGKIKLDTYICPFNWHFSIVTQNFYGITKVLFGNCSAGNWVAYISNESGAWGLWTVSIDGQNKEHWFDIDSNSGVFNTDEWGSDRMSWRR